LKLTQRFVEIITQICWNYHTDLLKLSQRFVEIIKKICSIYSKSFFKLLQTFIRINLNIDSSQWIHGCGALRIISVLRTDVDAVMHNHREYLGTKHMMRIHYLKKNFADAAHNILCIPIDWTIDRKTIKFYEFDCKRSLFQGLFSWNDNVMKAIREDDTKRKLWLSENELDHKISNLDGKRYL
jgi:hypothetical protein